MKLFSLDKSFNIVWEPQTLLIKPFAAIFKRDRTLHKLKATAELAFIWFYTDIKSDYQIHTDTDLRTKCIIADLKGLPSTWKPDKIVKAGIKFYEDNSSTITAIILKDSMYVANKLSGKLVTAVDKKDLDINDITKLLEGVKKMPDIIKAIQIAEKAVLKEIQEREEKIGSKEKATFEDGEI